ncbi:ATP-binding protein [Frankia sp. AiPa1]|uniref:sensor histidine kinase n=1 Tax=Frankia sp. AiPa1 TaxID=573492 RepID=UPI00202B5138|nr:ATP-binding protein [Frankia sp. AiPa1]MCL9758682.1 hypothetical protein [Frankia sp. AiPa1]
MPTTAAGAEFVLVIGMLGYRGVDLIQAAVTMPNALDRSPRPALCLFFTCILVIESAVLAVLLLRRGRYDDARVGILELVSGVGLLLATMTFTQPSDRFANWADWGFPVTLGTTVGMGVVFQRWSRVFGATALLAGAYLVSTGSVPSSSNSWSNAVTNTSSYFGFALVVRALAGYLRRLAADADLARRRVEQLAREAERERTRLLLHDQESVLRLAASDGLDPTITAAVRVQAASGATRIRAYLENQNAESGDLAACLRTAAAEFADLAPVLNVHLARGAVPAAQVGAITSAVRTLLHNVRRHARADTVTLHAQSTEGGGWEISVRDDGAGFDQFRQAEGFGLRVQVRAQLAAVGGHTEVRSSPGAGTSVRMWRGGAA